MVYGPSIADKQFYNEKEAKAYASQMRRRKPDSIK